jgi:hypothetical protein
MKLKPDKLVEVMWRDSNIPAPTWLDETDMEENHKGDMLIRSAGYVYKIGKKYLTLYGGGITGNYKKSYMRVVSIPIGCIQKVRKI